jgi:hypothetical protein
VKGWHQVASAVGTLAIAAIIGALVIGFEPTVAVSTEVATLPPELVRAYESKIGLVETEMRNVRYHSAGAVLEIRQLRGALRPTSAETPPWFEDPQSFIIEVDTAQVNLSAASLSAMLTNHVFNYPGSPLKKLEVQIEGNELIQRGKLHHLPFRIKSELRPTADGRLRLHPNSVKVIGISVKGLMNLFGVELDDLIKSRGRGMQVDENDIILAPSALLPAPGIDGRVTAVTVTERGIATVFGKSNRPQPLPALHPTDSTAPNYMYFQGSRLRFGKLTMADTDLQIVDLDPTDPFDFNLVHVNEQLVAGRSHNQPDFGLVTMMPDYADLSRSNRPPPPADRRSREKSPER